MTFVQRSRGRGWQARAVFLAAFAVLLTVRLWGGFNYGSVFVQTASQAAGSAGLRVYAWMPQRSFLRELERIPEVPQVWMLQSQVDACESVLVVCPAGADAVVGTLRVVSGDSWTGPIRILSAPGDVIRCQNQVLLKALAAEIGAVVYELPVRRSSSVIPGIRGFNWQGDFWLLLVPLLQALLFCRLVSFISSLVPSNTPGGWGEIAPVSRSWIGVGVGVLRLVVLLLVLHQVVQVVYRLVAVRSGPDAAVGAVCSLGLLQGLWYFLRAAGEGRVGGGLRGFLCVVALIAVVRVVWILNVDSYQSTDYARYLQIGEQIYDGRWDLLASREETLTPIYIRRALFATLPAIWLFGKGLAGLECWNLCIQLMTLLVFRRLVRLLTGSPAVATAAVVLLTLMPEFWYSITIATHNVVANLLICCVMLVLELIRVRLRDTDGKGWWQFAGDLWLASAAGCCGAMLELCRSFGVFFLVAVWGTCLCLLAYRFLSSGGHCVWNRDLRVFGMLGWGTVVCIGSVSLVDHEIASRVPWRTPPITESIVAVDTLGTGLGREMEAWRVQYFPAVPGSEKSELAVRRLLHEKLASGVQIWFFLMRRNDVYSWQSDALVQVFDRLQGLIRPLKHTRVRWFSAQQAVCDAYYLLILLLLFVRLLLPQRYPVLKSEVLPLVFVGLIALALYLLTEAHPYYAQSFLLPFCWTASMVAVRGVKAADTCSGGAAVADGHVWRELLAGLRSLRIPAVILCGVIAIHGVGGAWLNRSGLLFARISLNQSAGAAGSLLTQQSRVHVAVALPPRTAGGASMHDATVRLDGPREAGGSLRFLLTAGQRTDKTMRLSPNQSPIRFRLLINGRIYREGVLADLNRPEFCVVPNADWGIQPGRPVELQIHLEGQPAADALLPEWLAIEYPYFSDKSGSHLSAVSAPPAAHPR